MTLWHPRRQSDLPLDRVWRVLGRQHIGVEHFCDSTGWRLQVDRLVKRPDGYAKVRIADLTAADDLDVVIAALPVLPGLAVRLALLEAIL